MTSLALTLRQVAFQNRSFWRNFLAAFFTVAFPLMFLVIFNGLLGNSDFYVPAVAALSVITACFTNIAISVSIARDEGVLKRIRGTPLPASAYLAARILHATLLAVLLVAVVVVAGDVLYGVDPPFDRMAHFGLALVVGAASFCALGLAVTAAIPNAEGAPAIVNAIILPLMFISDVFIPSDHAPAWLQTLADVFPVKHFAEAMLSSFDPGFRTWEWSDLAIVALWGVAAVLFARRYFTWEPRS